MSNKPSTAVSNVASERAVLSGICKFGLDALTEVDDLLKEESFTEDINKIIFKCLRHALANSSKVEFADLLASANKLNLFEIVNKKENLEHIRAMFNMPCQLESVREHGETLVKLEFSRGLQNKLRDIYRSLSGVNGDESLSEIMSLAELPIQELSLEYIRESQGPQRIGENIEEYIEYLASNPTDNIGLGTGFPEWDEAIGGGLRRQCVDVIGARQKALIVGSKVYTPNGPVNIELLNVGDKVLTPNGDIATILKVWDHKNADVYRVHFRDGDHIDCSKDHLWEVYKRYPYGKLEDKNKEVRSVEDLIDDTIIGNQQEYKWDIALPQPLKFHKQSVPIDPYVLGLLLGDGSLFHTAKLHVGHEDVEYVGDVLKKSYDDKVKIDHTTDSVVTFRINGLISVIKALGLHKKNCYTKFIPNEYKYNSKDVRIAVLSGLMDTDGCASNNRCRYSTTSKQLALDVKEIVHSLGGLCSLLTTTTTCQGKKFSSYLCEIRLNDIIPFRMPRKLSQITGRVLGELKRSISKIEKLNTKSDMRCITLDSKDGTFMTDHCIITHNCGKSYFADNVAAHIAKQGIPVLMLDTEMGTQDHHHRLLSLFSGLNPKYIAKGKFVEHPVHHEKIREAAKVVKNMTYDYQNVSGRSFDEILAIMRRWIMKNVGYDENGRLKDCLIIYDYLKLMSDDALKSMQEFQVMGFQMTRLHNFCVKYDCPCLTFVQLNRDGIQKEDTSVISQSDRIGWLCTSFTIFKEKTQDEINHDGPDKGNRKLVPIVSRHGEGMGDGGYICVQMDGGKGLVKELGTIYELKDREKKSQTGFEIDGELDEAIESA